MIWKGQFLNECAALADMICNAGGFETSDYIWYHGCGIVRLNKTDDLLIAAFFVRKNAGRMEGEKQL